MTDETARYEFWAAVSTEPQILWDFELVERFQGQLVWAKLSEGVVFRLTFAWLERFQSHFRFRTVSRITDPARIEWSLELLSGLRERFKAAFKEWSSTGGPLGWSSDFLTQFSESLDWYSVSLSCPLFGDPAVIEAFQGWVVWRALSFNGAVVAQLELLRRYQTRLDWSVVTTCASVPWSGAVLEEFETDIDFERVSQDSSFPWSEALIDRSQLRLNFHGLSNLRENFPKSTQMVEKFSDRWGCGSKILDPDSRGRDAFYSRGLSANPALPWDQAFYERFKARWVEDRLLENPAARGFLAPPSTP